MPIIEDCITDSLKTTVNYKLGYYDISSVSNFFDFPLYVSFINPRLHEEHQESPLSSNLGEKLIDILNDLKRKPSGNYERTILFNESHTDNPTENSGNHWTVGFLTIDTANREILIEYIDSKPRSQKYQQCVEQELNTNMAFQLSVHPEYETYNFAVNYQSSGVQHDGWSCGFWVIQSILKRFEISDERVEKIINSFDAYELQRAVFEFILTHIKLNNDELRLAQENNIPLEYRVESRLVNESYEQKEVCYRFAPELIALRLADLDQTVAVYKILPENSPPEILDWSTLRSHYDLPHKMNTLELQLNSHQRMYSHPLPEHVLSDTMSDSEDEDDNNLECWAKFQRDSTELIVKQFASNSLKNQIDKMDFEPLDTNWLFDKTLQINIMGHTQSIPLLHTSDNREKIIINMSNKEIRSELLLYKTMLVANIDLHEKFGAYPQLYFRAIALLRELIYRRTGSLPSDREITMVLHSLKKKESFTAPAFGGLEQTRVALIYSLLLCLSGSSVDFVLDNAIYCKNIYDEFLPLFKFLGIETTHFDAVQVERKTDVIFSTPEELVLSYASQQLRGGFNPKNQNQRALVIRGDVKTVNTKQCQIKISSETKQTTKVITLNASILPEYYANNKVVVFEQAISSGSEESLLAKRTHQYQFLQHLILSNLNSLLVELSCNTPKDYQTAYQLLVPDFIEHLDELHRLFVENNPLENLFDIHYCFMVSKLGNLESFLLIKLDKSKYLLEQREFIARLRSQSLKQKMSHSVKHEPYHFNNATVSASSNIINTNFQHMLRGFIRNLFDYRVSFRVAADRHANTNNLISCLMPLMNLNLTTNNFETYFQYVMSLIANAKISVMEVDSKKDKDAFLFHRNRTGSRYHEVLDTARSQFFSISDVQVLTAQFDGEISTLGKIIANLKGKLKDVSNPIFKFLNNISNEFSVSNYFSFAANSENLQATNTPDDNRSSLKKWLFKLLRWFKNIFIGNKGSNQQEKITLREGANSKTNKNKAFKSVLILHDNLRNNKRLTKSLSNTGVKHSYHLLLKHCEQIVSTYLESKLDFCHDEQIDLYSILKEIITPDVFEKNYEDHAPVTLNMPSEVNEKFLSYPKKHQKLIARLMHNLSYINGTLLSRIKGKVSNSSIAVQELSKDIYLLTLHYQLKKKDIHIEIEYHPLNNVLLPRVPEILLHKSIVTQNRVNENHDSDEINIDQMESDFNDMTPDAEAAGVGISLTRIIPAPHLLDNAGNSEENHAGEASKNSDCDSDSECEMYSTDEDDFQNFQSLKKGG